MVVHTVIPVKSIIGKQVIIRTIEFKSFLYFFNAGSFSSLIAIIFSTNSDSFYSFS